MLSELEFEGVRWTNINLGLASRCQNGQRRRRYFRVVRFGVKYVLTSYNFIDVGVDAFWALGFKACFQKHSPPPSPCFMLFSLFVPINIIWTWIWKRSGEIHIHMEYSLGSPRIKW